MRLSLPASALHQPPGVIFADPDTHPLVSVERRTFVIYFHFHCPTVYSTNTSYRADAWPESLTVVTDGVIEQNFVAPYSCTSMH